LYTGAFSGGLFFAQNEGGKQSKTATEEKNPHAEATVGDHDSPE
jgi:hypothetical protein